MASASSPDLSSSWLGEWGQIEKSGPYDYSGGRMSIQDCNQNKCFIRIRTGKPMNNKGCNFIEQVFLKDKQQATVNTSPECSIELSLETVPKSRKIVAKLVGKGCQQHCHPMMLVKSAISFVVQEVV